MAEASPFQFRDYRAFWCARLASTIANTMLVVVIGFHVYDIARETMSIREASFWLGMVGLAQFLPCSCSSWSPAMSPTGSTGGWIVRLCLAAEMLCAAALAALVWLDAMSLAPLFAVAILLGIGRAFAGPALGLDRAQSGPARAAAERDRPELDRLAGRARSPGRCSAARSTRSSRSLPYEASAVALRAVARLRCC